MNLSEAKGLMGGMVIYAKHYHNADGTKQRFKVNGQVKTWKTRPDEVRVPLKRGLYEYGYLDHDNMGEFSLTEE